VERRELVIWWGRKTQNLLRIPQCLRVFADTDPGMLDADIRSAVCMLIPVAGSISLGDMPRPRNGARAKVFRPHPSDFDLRLPNLHDPHLTVGAGALQAPPGEEVQG